MLDVIGAGATAVADRDWRQVWVDSKECQALEDEIDQLHAEGRSHPPVAATVTTQFATPWTYQTRTLLQRQNLAFWRDPTYLMSKLSLNIIGGLFIGFTFFKSKNTIQGTQNKLFVRILLMPQLLAPLLIRLDRLSLWVLSWLVFFDYLVLDGFGHTLNVECSVRWTITCAIYQGILCIGLTNLDVMFDKNCPDARHL